MDSGAALEQLSGERPSQWKHAAQRLSLCSYRAHPVALDTAYPSARVSIRSRAAFGAFRWAVDTKFEGNGCELVRHQLPNFELVAVQTYGNLSIVHVLFGVTQAYRGY